MPTQHFLHSADWQLGMSRHFLRGEAQARFTAARIDTVRAIGRLAADLDCAFVVVCGDVFESNQIDRQVLVRALDAMAAVPVPLYLLPGNHDPLDAASIYRSAAFRQHVPGHVHVLDTFEPVQAAPGVWLYPAPWTSKRPLEDLAARAAGLAQGEPGAHILVAHGMVDVLSPGDTDPATIDLAGLEQAIAGGRLHYVALGDRHSVTEVGGTGRVWYSGAPEATDYDELASGYVLAVALSPDADRVGVEVERRHVGGWRFQREVHAVTDAADLEQLAARLDGLEGKERTVLKLGFEGTLTLRDKARLDDILAHYGDLFAAVEPWHRRTELAVLPDDGDFDGLGLVGFAADAVDELRQRAARPGEEGAVAQDALALLVRLASGDRA